MKYISILFGILFGITACSQTPQVEKAASVTAEAKPASFVSSNQDVFSTIVAENKEAPKPVVNTAPETKPVVSQVDEYDLPVEPESGQMTPAQMLENEKDNLLNYPTPNQARGIAIAKACMNIGFGGIECKEVAFVCAYPREQARRQGATEACEGFVAAIDRANESGEFAYTSQQVLQFGIESDRKMRSFLN
jgi:lipoprotein|nr:MAG TPA: lipoprotein [Caudoviricetes sp.]